MCMLYLTLYFVYKYLIELFVLFLTMIFSFIDTVEGTGSGSVRSTSRPSSGNDVATVSDGHRTVISKRGYVLLLIYYYHEYVFRLIPFIL